MATIKELRNLENGRFIGIGNSRYYKVVEMTKNGFWLTHRFYLGCPPAGKWFFGFSQMKNDFKYWYIVPLNSLEARDLKASAKP